MPQHQLYVGLMSGTSADAVDAVVVDLQSTPILLAKHTLPLPSNTRQQIHALSLPGNNEIDRMGALDVNLGKLFAQATLELLAKANLSTTQISAIGSHGQTIRHRPPGSREGTFTLQIGDPNLIGGPILVASQRRRDMAAGGQGAPLVPAFHRAIFHAHDKDRVVVNIGGMANITWLPAQGLTLGFDTGPGNVLMDTWIAEHRGESYDQDGIWAASGQARKTLLAELLATPYFQLKAPKSTGRESFNRAWLDGYLQKLSTITTADVQATLLELTAITIADSINGLSRSPKDIFVCGGGAYNTALMQKLKVLVPNDTLASTAVLGVDPQWIEAMAFAWLAQQTITHRTGNLCEVTGAKREVILGGVYCA